MPASISLRLSTAALAVVLLLVLMAGRARAADTVVTFGFDDGLASQYTHRGVLTEHGIHATYFINSGKVGDLNRVSWADIAQLAAEGHEIGGHTLDHVQLTTLDEAGQTHAICDDKAALEAHGLTDGYTIRNLAYPFGLWNATTKLVVPSCGYETGRTTGGTDYPSGPIYAETFPPLNAYTLRAVMPRLTTPFVTWQDIVQKARDSGGGWVNIVMHDLCDAPCTGFDQYSVDVALFDQVLDWLDTLPDVKIRTTAHALDVSTDVTAPAVALTAPSDGATVTGTVALTADASDTVGVDHVDFLVDGVVVGSDDTAPYTFGWDSSSAGDAATFTARASDDAGHTTTSAAHAVTITHPDVTAPAVALTLPQDGEIVTGLVPLAADASDNVGVTRVDFLVDGDVVGSDDTAPYTFTWDSSAAGVSATITAQAFDAADNSTVSGARLVTVFHPDVTPPSVALTAPADGATVTGMVTLSADATDTGGVDHVDFLVDGDVIGSDTSAPYSVDWDSSAAGGTATIVATAFDAAHNSTDSASRTVTVSHPLDPPPIVIPPILDPPTFVPSLADTRKPSVRVTDVVLREDRFEVRVDARDAGGVSAVRVLLPGGVVRSDSTAPFAVSWWARPGRHMIAADATDRAGNRRRSARVRVDVRRTVRRRGSQAVFAVTVRR